MSHVSFKNRSILARAFASLAHVDTVHTWCLLREADAFVVRAAVAFCELSRWPVQQFQDVSLYLVSGPSRKPWLHSHASGEVCHGWGRCLHCSAISDRGCHRLIFRLSCRPQRGCEGGPVCHAFKHAHEQRVGNCEHSCPSYALSISLCASTHKSVLNTHTHTSHESHTLFLSLMSC